jgi:hypothetical protein
MRHFDRILTEILDDSIPDSLIARRVKRWWRIYQPAGVDVYLGPEHKLFLNIDSCKGGRCVEIVDSLQRYVGNHISIFYSDNDRVPEGFELIQAATETTVYNEPANVGTRTY